MLDLWKNITAKYPDVAFGYSDRELFINLSVFDKKSLKSMRQQLEVGLSLQEYANIWTGMLKELYAPADVS